MRSLILDGQSLNSMRDFRYLKSMIVADGNEEMEVTWRIQVGWKNWCDMSGALCDRRMPAMMYGLKTVPIKKCNEKKMEVAEMRLLRWMSGVTRKDRI